MRLAGIIVCCVMLAACSDYPAEPPLTVSNLSIYAPLPGSNAAVAYLDLTNNGDTDILVSEVSSPGFGRVEIHESLLEAGISSMRRIESLSIVAGKSVSLNERGKHLMLMDPRSGPELGTPVSLEIRYDATGGVAVLIVRATLESRVRLDVN